MSSLQHDVPEVLLQDRVLDGMEDEADVFCVDGGGEVVEERFAAVPALSIEALHQVGLDVLHPVGISTKVREMLADVHLLVVDYGFKDVHGLHQTIGASVLHQHLVVFTGGDHEEDGCDAIKALEPFLPLRALTSDVHHLEWDLLDDKVMLHDALGCLPGLYEFFFFFINTLIINYINSFESLKSQGICTMHNAPFLIRYYLHGLNGAIRFKYIKQ
uniref:Uncharacterized protein n=1 Tax=Denticeps clupeoides TaxID=299321 RepID=A0AAY4DIQ4_9TELE